MLCCSRTPVDETAVVAVPYVPPQPLVFGEKLKRYLDRGVCWGTYDVEGHTVGGDELRVCVITLESTPTRHARILASLRHHNVQATICIMTAPDDIVYADYKGILSRGELGCVASHAWVLKMFGSQRLVILEDDVDFHAKFTHPDMWTHALSRDVVLLGASDWHIEKRDKQVGYYDAHLAQGRVCGTFAYSIAPKAAKRMQEYLRTHLVPSDHAFNDLWKSVRVLYPPLVISDRTTTSIENHSSLASMYAERCLQGIDLTQYISVPLNSLQLCKCLSTWPLTCRHCSSSFMYKALDASTWSKETIQKTLGQSSLGNVHQLLHLPESATVPSFPQHFAVAMVTFNPCNYKKPALNAKRCIAQFSACKIPVFFLELTYGKAKPSFTRESLGKHASYVAFFHVSADSIMFHKENLWNVLESKIPLKYSKIAFLDADILLHNPLVWAWRTCEALNKYPIVQPFSSIKSEENMEGTLHSKQVLLVASASIRNETFNYSMSYPSPGYGVAVQRSWLKSVQGFVDSCIVGGGDLITLLSILQPEKLLIQQCYIESPFAHKDIARFQANCAKVCTTVGFVQYEGLHLYHGSRMCRQYTTRHELMKGLTLKDLRKNSAGIYEFMSRGWTNRMHQYFQQRKEDD